jgi:exportin-5
MYRTESVNLLKRIYDWSIVDASDIDEDRYTLCKKLAEMMSNLGAFIEQKSALVPKDGDIPSFLRLFYEMLCNESLTVSIPILNSWNKLLRSESTSSLSSFLQGPLIEICTRRLMRYESLPEDSDDPTMVFLLEDIDTMPERHAFLGNYRRYCMSVVEMIVRRKPFDAMNQVLSGVDKYMAALVAEEASSYRIETFSKTSMTFLQGDAHFTIVEAALKGYTKWVAGHGSTPQQSVSDLLERMLYNANSFTGQRAQRHGNKSPNVVRESA